MELTCEYDGELVPKIRYGAVTMYLPADAALWANLRGAIYRANENMLFSDAVSYAGRVVADVYRGQVRFFSGPPVEFILEVPCGEAIGAICRGCDILAGNQ